MRRAKGADLIVLVAVLAAFAAGNVWLARRGARQASGLELAPDASAFNSGPSGLQGLYFFWRELGYETQVWRRPMDRLPEEAGLLVVAAPFPYDSQLGPQDNRELVEWAKSGHTLLVLGADPDLSPLAGASVRPGGEKRREVRPSAPSGLMTGVEKLRLAQDRWDDLSGSVVVHAADARGPALISRPLGRGQVIALADSSSLANGHLAESDNAILAANLAAFAKGPIYFDEYHHGFRERPTLAGVLFRPPLLWATLQALVALGLFVHAASRRFGAAIPLRPAPRYRASAEYVAALAALYQRAGAKAAVLERLAQGFRREVGRALGLPANAPAARIAELAARRSGVEASRVERVLRLCEEQVASGSRPKEGLLLSLGAELESLRRQVLRVDRETATDR
jgi:hypothetical protein